MKEITILLCVWELLWFHIVRFRQCKNFSCSMVLTKQQFFGRSRMQGFKKFYLKFVILFVTASLVSALGVEMITGMENATKRMCSSASLVLYPVLRIRCLFDPGSGIRNVFFPDPGSPKNPYLMTNCWVKSTIFFVFWLKKSFYLFKNKIIYNFCNICGYKK